MNKKVFNNIKFIVLLIVGVFVFLVPFSLPFPGFEEKTILISHFSALVKDYFLTPFIYITLVVQVFIVLSALVGLYRRITKKDLKYPFLNELCGMTYPMIITKIVGAIFFTLVALKQLGIDFSHNPTMGSQLSIFIGNVYNAIINPDTGGTTFDLVLSLFLTFFAGNLLLPFLTDFGAVEFVGNLASRVMHKLFGIPGYSAIDAVASFVGDGTIGILVTDRQYQRGYYTQRQAGIIATSFSIVGIAFATLVANTLGFSNYFGIFYGTIILVTIVLAMVLSHFNFFNFKDTYYNEDNKKVEDSNVNFKQAYEIGVEVCAKANIKTIIVTAFKQIITTFIIFVPTIMCVGTLGLMLSTYTPVFTWISTPFIPILQFLGFGSSAEAMAPGLFVGLADMYLPTLFVSDPALTISSAAKFFIGVLSFCQLVFLSETGMVLLNTKIGFKFKDILKLFAIRTLLSIPIILLVTYILSFFGIVSF